MEAFLIFIGVIGAIFLFVGAIVALATWFSYFDGPCRHSYERIDNCNDKKCILVCRKCVKIKKLRK
jgi:hypothetical protein